MKTMKKTVIWPTDEEDAAITAAALQDEDNPPLTDEEMAEMVPHAMRWSLPGVNAVKRNGDMPKQRKAG